VKPGEVICAEGDLVLNEGVEAVTLMVANTGDRPVQGAGHAVGYCRRNGRAV